MKTFPNPIHNIFQKLETRDFYRDEDLFTFLLLKRSRKVIQRLNYDRSSKAIGLGSEILNRTC